MLDKLEFKQSESIAFFFPNGPYNLCINLTTIKIKTYYKLESSRPDT